MVQLRHNCDCKTCKGGESQPNTFGGWHCTCHCHLSGHPVDSQEHKAWEEKQREEHLKRTLEAIEDLHMKPERPRELR